MFRTESDHKLSEIFISQYAVLKKRIHSLGNAVNDPVRSEFLLDDVFAGDAVHHRDDDGIFRDQTFDALQKHFPKRALLKQRSASQVLCSALRGSQKGGSRGGRWL